MRFAWSLLLLIPLATARAAEPPTGPIIVVGGEAGCTAPKPIDTKGFGSRLGAGWAEVEWTVTVEGRVVDVVVLAAEPARFGSRLAKVMVDWTFKPASCASGPRAARLRERYSLMMAPRTG